jgi:large subunit ribosomal protein L25
MKLSLRTEKLNRVRAQQLVPGVMYGKSIDSVSVQTNDKDIKDALKNYGKNMTFQVELDGEVHNVYIKKIQSNILKPQEIVHFDLHCISATETITAQIPIVIIGKEKFYQTQAYPQEGLSSIEAEFTVGNGMQNIEIDISKMEIGDAIHVKDLELNENITIKDDPEDMIVVIKEASMEEEVEEDLDEDLAEGAEEEDTAEESEE